MSSYVKKITVTNVEHPIIDSRISENISSSQSGQVLTVQSDGSVAPGAISTGVQSVSAGDNSMTVTGSSAVTVAAKLSATPGLLSLASDGLAAAEAANTVHDASYAHITVSSTSVTDGTNTLTPVNTTYTFTDGTGSFTVTPSSGSAQTVTVTPTTAAVATLGAVKYAQGSGTIAASGWTSDTTYTDYPYRYAIAIANCTANHFPEVVFDLTTATGGKVAPVCDSYAGGIYVYAKENISTACSYSYRVTYNA